MLHRRTPLVSRKDSYIAITIDVFVFLVPEVVDDDNSHCEHAAQALQSVQAFVICLGSELSVAWSSFALHTSV